ncbi:DUF4384 domain-containing protein [Brachyspira innocens]|uniref:DUF4384 domain-containing protein n=1 Tax=Brachyspira innocens TaxID=13264 RepID=UPI0026EDD092|nr:DUF4384 domain-containing protein [Brachyspira innocens]MDO6993781.1 DUF4384 domain-containing protein [Brachyspira innocens]
MPIATIDLDHSLRENEPLRKELVRTINRFAYLKQKTSISVDRTKKKLFSTNELTLEQGLTVASNLNIKAAIIMDSEKVLKSTNNTVSNNNIVINSDNINTVLSNYNITNNMISNDIVITNGITLTNEIKDLGDLIEYGIGKKTEGTDKAADEKSDEELYDIKYNFKVIDIETMETLKEYELKTSSETISVIQEICTYLEFYFSNYIFKSFEPPINGVNLTLRIDRISLENKTNSIYNSGEIIEGESFSLNFRSNTEGYIYIFAFQNDGTVILMHPNDFNNYIDNQYHNKIESRKNYIVPPENSIFKIVISPPFGEDSFYCLYTKKEQKWITGTYFSGDGFKICNKNKIAEFTAKLKSTLKWMNRDNWQISSIYLKSIPEIPETETIEE